MWAVHHPVEIALARSPHYLASVSSATARLRSHLVPTDLRALGAPALPDLVAPPPLETLPQVLGAAYVFEGATLGGVVLARELRAYPDLAGAEFGYLAGRGDAVGPLWRSFCRDLDAAGLSAGECDDALTTAVGLFDRIADAAARETGGREACA